MEPSPQPVAAPQDHLKRRLSDSILRAFHTACDERATEIAWRLLDQLELLILRGQSLPSGSDNRRYADLSAPRERLRNLILWDSLSTACIDEAAALDELAGNGNG